MESDKMPQVTERELYRAYQQWEARQSIRRREPPQFIDFNFPEQTAFITDPSKLKVVLCTRRSGKSYGAGLYLYKEAYENPGVSCLYIALTRQSAKNIMWKDIFKVINRKLKLNAIFNETELSATLPNGSIIYLLGVDSTEEEKRKLLGQKYKLVVIDEAAQFTIDLRELIFGILKPAVADYRGTIALIGTPANLKRGLYFELTSGQDPCNPSQFKESGWSGHRWSASVNPYIKKQWQEEIEELKATNPRIEETPLFQQHYLGRWVIDESKLVYRYLSERNELSMDLPELPRGSWHYILGVDLGYEDPTAFSICAYHDFLKELYVLESTKKAKLDVTAVADAIRTLQNKYEIEKILIDNSNKQAVEEMKKRHNLPLHPADKTGKSDFIELMNGDFILGKIKLSAKCQALKDEYANLIWDEKKMEETGKRQEHDACENHCADATLYAWRYCYQYLSESLPRPLPKPHSQEWFEWQRNLNEDSVRQMEEEEIKVWEEKMSEKRMLEEMENEWAWDDAF